MTRFARPGRAPQFATIVVGLFLAGWISGGPQVTFAWQLELPQQVRTAEQQRIDTIARTLPVSVNIFGPQGQGGGSGVLVASNGECLTNYHVIQACGPSMKCGLPDGRLVDAVIVGIDPTGDLALIRLLGDDPFPSATWADSDTAQVGDACFCLGNPFLLATDLRPSVSWGQISGTHRYQYPAGSILEYADCLQTDAAINPGNSGGGLFDQQGRLLGINGRCSFEKRGRINVGVGYAISANQARRFLTQLQSGRLVDHATAGFTVTRDRGGQIRVSSIDTTSPAFRRGMRYGDELLEFAGQPINTVNQFKNLLGTYPARWRVPIRFRNEEQEFESVIRLSPLHGSGELHQIVYGENPTGPSLKPDHPAAPFHSSGKGFANRLANEVVVNELWQRRPPLAPNWRQASWQLQGQSEEGPVRVLLGETESGINLAGRARVLQFDESVAPADIDASTALLLGLQLWRQWYRATDDPQLGLAPWSPPVYWGRQPDLEGQELACLETSLEGILCRLWVTPESGSILEIEVESGPASDPWALRFVDAPGETNRELRSVALQRPDAPALRIDWTTLEAVARPALEEGDDELP